MLAKLWNRTRVVSSRPAAVVRYVGLSFVLVLLFLYFQAPARVLPHDGGSGRPFDGKGKDEKLSALPPVEKPGPGEPPKTRPPLPPTSGADHHPIAKLMRDAEAEFAGKLGRQAKTLEEAAAAYRKRRNRHPPPGFEVWYQFATDHNAIVVEDFWDQIYDDLEPYWAVPAPQIRKEAWDFEMVITVRNGTASAQSDWFWTKIWLEMMQQIEAFLPDMDIALNAMDEPRVVVPWEHINDLVTKAQKSKVLFDPTEAITTYEVLPAPGQGRDRTSISKPKAWETHRPFMEIAKRGCPPDSAARTSPVEHKFEFPTCPTIDTTYASAHMTDGFVSNYTLSTNLCHQPDLQNLTGIFIDPLSVRSTKTLFPIFGGSKLSVNNEILIPPAMYWGGEGRFISDDEGTGAWKDKEAGAVWRGVASGGYVRARNWRAFQRHRFVSMNNGTKLSLSPTTTPENFVMPDQSVYAMKSLSAGADKMGRWVDSWANIAFMDLHCLRQDGQKDGEADCPFTDAEYITAEGVKLAEMYRYKLLPDIDGNSFSGRYLGFLRSSSLPVKATMWREWHDSRLTAWVHFVPMDSRFGDWLPLVEYFLGYTDPETGEVVAPAHDSEAERIASAGKEWAEKTLRREDMLVYMLRLMLEFARVSDEKRERMGFVEDLLPS